jgi:hypothetical protein
VVDRQEGTLAARGAPSAHSIRRDVGVTLRRGASRLSPLAEGDEVPPGAEYAVSYRNLGATGSAYVMVFAVDAAQAVHWIQPAWLDATQDPASVELAHAPAESALPSATVLEAPAPGPLRVITLVSPTPLRVSQIEPLRGPDLELARLRARFPDVEAAEITVQVRAEGGAGRIP